MDLTPTWQFWCVYTLARFLGRLLFRVQWVHRELVPADGPVIVASNHVSLFDPGFIALGLPWKRTTRYMAKEELFEGGFTAWFCRTVGAFPVKRGVADRGAIRVALSILKAEGVVGIFPEGHRIKEGMVAEVHQGAAFLAVMGGATLIPAGLSGTDHLWPSSKRLRFARVTVVFGEPIPASVVDHLPRGERVAALTTILMDGIDAAKVEADAITARREGRA